MFYTNRVDQQRLTDSVEFRGEKNTKIDSIPICVKMTREEGILDVKEERLRES
jgi:hypothetical protein